MHRASLLALALLLAAAVRPAAAQQVADSAYTPPIARPSFAEGRGPVVLIDEGHHNFHTVDGRYHAFAKLLRRDGFVVRGHAGPLTAQSLAGARVLVIANALHQSNDGGNWTLPTPSAFTPDEIAAVRRWVEEGGSLMLVADHMPFAGAAEALGAAFGVRFANSFAHDSTREGGDVTFRRADGSLAAHPATRGRAAGEAVDSVVSFTGSAFRVEGAEHAALLRLPATTVQLLPDTAWRFTPETPRITGSGWLQGAALPVGRGRVAVFGEAAMFTAQLGGPNRTPAGMNSPRAPQNHRFALGVVRWLAGVLDEAR